MKMSYFAEGTIEDEILADVQYFQRKSDASNAEVLYALLKVANYFAEVVKNDDERKS